MKEKINPTGLKGNQITERMKELMGIQAINENKRTSVVELTKKGPDGKVYGIVRENHEYYIKVTEKQTNLIPEDFKYIGGLQNKKQEAYPSYAKAIKHLNLKFHSINEALGRQGNINVFEDDKLMREDWAGFAEMSGPMFKAEGNLEGHMKSDCCGAQTMEGMCMECGGPAYGTMGEMGMTGPWSPNNNLGDDIENNNLDEPRMMGEKKYSDAASEFISKEISHLMKDKGYTQDRAVAAALSVAREKGYKVPQKSDESMHMADEALAPEMEAVDAMMEKEEEMTDKEKEFAALAPPHDKITYADKIAGATKGKTEGKLSIERALTMMDEVIDELHESKSKKKL